MPTFCEIGIFRDGGPVPHHSLRNGILNHFTALSCRRIMQLTFLHIFVVYDESIFVNRIAVNRYLFVIMRQLPQN